MYYKVYFTLDSEYNHKVTMEVEPKTSFAELIFKYCSKIGKDANNLSFEYNSKKLNKNSWKSLKELGITNEAEIKVCSSENKIPYINVCFIYESHPYMIQADSKMKFSELVNKFYSKAQIKEEKQPIFIFGIERISEDSNSTLEQLGINGQSKIDVLLIGTLEGDM